MPCLRSLASLLPTALLPISWLPSRAAAQVARQSALQPAGVQAETIFSLWNFTLALCAAVFAAIVLALLVALLVAFRRAREARQAAADSTSLSSRPSSSLSSSLPSSLPPDLAPLHQPERRVHRTVLLATAIATVGLVMLLVADVWTGRMLARLPLNEAVKIELTGHQFWWEVRYPDEGVTTANELHVPVGRPVVVTLKSRDVIHTLWVPNLAGKRDMIPGRTATISLRADKPGVYRAQCAEFCGLQHALMALPVTAVAPAQYERWAQARGRAAPEPASDSRRLGREVFVRAACAACHTIAGTMANGTLGPDLTHLASRPTLAAGMLPNDRANLQAWIVDPHRFKLGANMPPSPLPARDMHALLDYLESLE
ncbi:cytochrome c oxidase subunit II [Pseudoduganella umbonata]|uniref:cytochrome-c oxidase n=1 Tax=Pseudoduganella umbonata TaxID=864828 RepID=A0A4P8HT45_9BURK|nr:cytochrome c oxidase subunit II [Pseudoduganella umbonata]MBB3220835.1 cytochrome c oxidase subunit 2 [Pseudoduganella umbonata]QCP11700.1 cytochrome c oxidase subunit II [Pseudoduganella umbonata]